jgi:hypothetical protein
MKAFILAVTATVGLSLAGFTGQASAHHGGCYRSSCYSSSYCCPSYSYCSPSYCYDTCYPSCYTYDYCYRPCYSSYCYDSCWRGYRSNCWHSSYRCHRR